MRHYIGLLEQDLRQKRVDTPVCYDPQDLINPHLLICGMSGTGKSYQALRFLASAAQSGIEIDVFDAHDELDQIPGAKACLFSQATQYGFNPLVLDTDPHTGGVDRQVSFFLGLIKSITPQFGIKQEAALRYLLVDTYAQAGISQGNRASWQKRIISESTRTTLIERQDYAALRDYYPTLEDLRAYTRRKVIALTLGSDNPCVTAFDSLTKMKRKLDALEKKLGKAVLDEDIAKLREQIEDQKQVCKESYGDFIDSMETGREIDDILKYDSVDVLTSVMQRLSVLAATGILSANEPPFGSSKVRVHQIKSCTHEQQVLYVKLRLQSIFDKLKRLGPVKPGEVRQIVFLDEAHKYFNNEPDDIINIIAREARKFGLGLWCASQQPTAFPESFLTNVGATMLLGIHTSYWKRAASMFRVSEAELRSVKPKEIMAIKMLREGQVDPPFTNVVLPGESSVGRRAEAYNKNS